MKNFKRIASLVLALTMILCMGVMAFAQDVDSGKNGNATITVSNASKGVTYKVVKLFDATVTGTENGSIFYTGTIPSELTSYFETKNSIPGDDDPDTTETKVDPYIVAKADAIVNGELSVDASNALKTWAEGQNADAFIVSDGTELTFTGLQYGYYVVLTSQGAGAVSVTSTNPTATVFDKNTTELELTKVASDDNVYIGQIVTYTVTANTANYLGEGKDAKIVTQYAIYDTLPDFLSDAKITEIKIDQPTLTDVTLVNTDTDFADITVYDADGNPVKDADENTVTQKGYIIEWATCKNASGNIVKDENGNTVWTSKYENGSDIIVTYTAKVTDKAVIDANEENDNTSDGNVNTVTLQPYGDDDGDGNPDPFKEKKEAKEEIYTYAAALQKVDDNKKPLAGAKFAADGLIVTPAKDAQDKVIDGAYVVEAYDNKSTVAGTVMTCDSEGQLVILGLPSDETLKLTETEAPEGYNKLVDKIDLKPVVTGVEITASETTIYYDANGKVTDEQTTTSYEKVTYNVELLKKAIQVINKAGDVLPSTGGIGTTIFYICGGVLLVGAAVLLITKRRMNING